MFPVYISSLLLPPAAKCSRHFGEAHGSYRGSQISGPLAQPLQGTTLTLPSNYVTIYAQKCDHCLRLGL